MNNYYNKLKELTEKHKLISSELIKINSEIKEYLKSCPHIHIKVTEVDYNEGDSWYPRWTKKKVTECIDCKRKLQKDYNEKDIWI